MVFEAPYICVFSLKNNELDELFSMLDNNLPDYTISAKKITIQQHHFCVYTEILIFFNEKLKKMFMKLLDAFSIK